MEAWYKDVYVKQTNFGLFEGRRRLATNDNKEQHSTKISKYKTKKLKVHLENILVKSINQFKMCLKY